MILVIWMLKPIFIKEKLWISIYNCPLPGFLVVEMEATVLLLIFFGPYILSTLANSFGSNTILEPSDCFVTFFALGYTVVFGGFLGDAFCFLGTLCFIGGSLAFRVPFF